MNHLSQVDLSASLQPVLIADERLLIVQDNAGIYDYQEKPTRANGKVYLTSHRVIYVDSKHPESNSVALELKRVKELEYMTGFLKSSRKIIFHFSSNSTTRKPTPTWNCPNCASSNTIQLKSCSFCGEKAPESPLASPTLQNNLHEGARKTIEHPCPNCSYYMNRVALTKCEMCTSELNSAEDFAGDYIRIGFKKGGSTQFYDKLQTAMNLKVWEQKNLDRIHG